MANLSLNRNGRLQDILPDLESSNHAEALTYMLLLLRSEKPTAELIRLLMSREGKSRGDPFVTSVLRFAANNSFRKHQTLANPIWGRYRFWCQEFEEELSEIIASLLTSKYQNSSPNKRKRTLKNNSTQNTLPTSEQVGIWHRFERCFVI